MMVWKRARRRARTPAADTFGALVLGAIVALAGQAQAAAGEPAVIVGRVTFRDNAHQAKAEDVERLRWGRLIVEMRRGWDVYAASLDANGFFSISGPPGKYRLDYVRVGQLSEFVVPHEVQARAGRVTCLGTLEISVADLGRDLGNNNNSQLRVRDDCAALGPEVHRLGNADAEIATSVATPVEHHWKGPSVMEIAAGLRAELAFDGKATTVRGSWLVPITEDTGGGNVFAKAELLHLSSTFENRNGNDVIMAGTPTASAKWGGAIGAGYSIWLIEAMIHGGFVAGSGLGEHGPMVGASVRLGTFLLGLGLDYERYPSSNNQLKLITLDLSPIGLLGSLL